MKLKHVILSGVLTAVAAVTLLTLVLPQTAEASRDFHFQCWYCNEGYWGEVPTRKEARGWCDLGGSYCMNEEETRVICSGCPQ